MPPFDEQDVEIDQARGRANVHDGSQRRKINNNVVVVHGVVRPMAPASALRTHANATIYLDEPSASLLSAATLRAFVAKP